jgi:hypothetical protein
MESTDISSTNCHQLWLDNDVFDSSDPWSSTASNRTRRRGNIIYAIILCYLNFINYVDKFTVAGKATVYISVLIWLYVMMFLDRVRITICVSSQRDATVSWFLL